MWFNKSHKEYAHSKLKLHIATHKEKVYRILQVLSLFISLTTIACIICYHGLYISTYLKNVFRWVIFGSLLFYVVKYFLMLFYSLHRIEYLKRSWFEGIIIALLILQFFSYFIFNFDLRMISSINFENYYLLFIQFYFLIIVLIEFTKVSGLMGRHKISPPVLMLLSFFMLILVGTVLLSMPRMTTNGISLIDALFTATSASCITGLTTVSTGTAFTIKGQIVIMILVQLGGMSILSFATFFSTFLSQSYVGLRYQYMVRDIMNTDQLSDTVSLVRSIVLTTFTIELVGAALLFTYWKTTGIFHSDGQNLFYSLFYAISAFNNGGFVLVDKSLLEMGVDNTYFPQIVMMALVFLGGIGFLTIRDFFSTRYIRQRNKYKWKKLMPQTQVVLLTTFALIIVGTILFFFIENKHALSGQGGLFDRMFVALFQIVTCRTSGFTVLDISSMHLSSVMIIILLMFIGGAPGSTGGGIKTTTLFVLVQSIKATVLGKKRLEHNHRTIPFSMVDRASTIVMMSLIFIFASCFLIAVVQPDVPLMDVMFETTSGFTTCGLSTGAPATWNWAAKLVLIFDMYIGRIGTLTIAFALTRQRKESQHQYPDMYIMVG
ncbi:MAG: hypothetical protein J6T86_05080 [Bacteroidales bacterium]|nr:hypothetical protein [Bacteroidales bacterium]